MNSQRRTIGLALLALVAVWLVAWAGHGWARKSRMTVAKVHQFVESVDFATLQGSDRQRALRQLADKLNALPFEERREVRLRRHWESWFAHMTETEKEEFIEATFPTGLKQMIAAFERLPEERRRRMLDESLRRLRDAGPEDSPPGSPSAFPADHGSPPRISPELEARIRSLGLQTFIAESSAQTKAEVAPLLEEIQRILESGGRVYRRR
ncbi:MAG: hypothetical protein JXQ71_05590 [Verrucomicrobia bacterium]|nr:hypothetical protein [Verrucomicrobiota bacterium]